VRLAVLAPAAIALALAAAGCGRGGHSDRSGGPRLGVKGEESQAAADLGFPGFATKNTTRVGGADPVADAAAVARAVHPGGAPSRRPRVVTLADGRDWQSALAASVLASAPLRAPVLLSDGKDLPAGTADVLRSLAPHGASEIAGGQVIRVGDVPRPTGLRSTDLAGRDPFTLARAIDALQAAASGRPSDAVVVVSADDPAFAMPAAAWAAKSGDPILFVHRGSVPAPTRLALARHQQPRIYVLGPGRAVSSTVFRALRRFGSVTRVAGPDPVRNAIAFARFAEGPFGWGVVDPGHGLVFASARRAADAAAAAPLSASGTYGPLLLTDGSAAAGTALEQYLLDIQPGYAKDPTRGVYNHGWIVGDQRAISIAAQSRIDSLLEIVPVSETAPPS
jgi:hypothetical protein